MRTHKSLIKAKAVEKYMIVIVIELLFVRLCYPKQTSRPLKKYLNVVE